MSDRLAAAGVAFHGAKPGGQPARAVLVERGSGERHVDPVAQSDQDAATRVEEPCVRDHLLGIESFNISAR
jgi:hypothetical protein